MAALIYIVQALLQYLLVTAFLLRLLLPLVRANMRNPLSQAVLRVTNPLVLPLRMVFPPVGRVDTASVLALLIVQALTIIIIVSLLGLPLAPGFLIKAILLALLVSTIQFYSFAVFIYVLLSWVAPATYSPASDLLNSLCDPLLTPVRRLIPPIAGLDLTAVFVLIGLQALLIALPRSMF
ncbi:MAG: YggT family protein [Candidatus Obscuribacterales bacterium]|nr:YggT family protein [Steroidobacteraceae bacterium]